MYIEELEMSCIRGEPETSTRIGSYLNVDITRYDTIIVGSKNFDILYSFSFLEFLRVAGILEIAF